MNHLKDENPERLAISGAEKLSFKIRNRDVYLFTGSIENAHIIFEDIEDEKNPPIVLIGNWKKDPTEEILSKTIGEVMLGISWGFLTVSKDENDFCHIQMFGKKRETDLPLVASEPVHATSSLLWQEIAEQKNHLWKSPIEKMQEELKRVMN